MGSRIRGLLLLLQPVSELLPSLPEASHMTLGTSIPASANSFHGQWNWAQAPGALCDCHLHLPWAPGWGAAGPLRLTSAVTRGPACLWMPPLSALTQGPRMLRMESGPHRLGRPPASSAGCKIRYLSVSRPRHAQAGVAPVAPLRLPKPASSSCGSREKQPDGHL